MNEYVVTLKIKGDISYGTLLDLLKENVEMKVKIFGPTVEIDSILETAGDGFIVKGAGQ